MFLYQNHVSTFSLSFFHPPWPPLLNRVGVELLEALLLRGMLQMRQERGNREQAERRNREQAEKTLVKDRII